MTGTVVSGAPPTPLVPRGLLLGITIVLVGLVFVADSLGMLDASTGWSIWPLGVIIAGIAVQLQPGTGSRVFGTFLVIAGLWLLLNAIGIWTYAFWRTWPLILILLGAWVGYRSWRFHHAAGRGSAGASVGDGAPSGPIAMLSHVGYRPGPSIAEAECSALAGDALFDLSQTARGSDPVILNVLVVAGRIRVAVPADWNVTLRVLALPGLVSDARREAGNVVSGQGTHADVIVRGTAVLGSITVVTSTGIPPVA